MGKTIGVLGDLLKNFDKDNNVAVEKDEHSTPSLKKDLIKELEHSTLQKNKNLSPNLIIGV